MSIMDVNEWCTKVQYFTYARNNYAKSHKSADFHVILFSTNRFAGFGVTHPLFFSLH